MRNCTTCRWHEEYFNNGKLDRCICACPERNTYRHDYCLEWGWINGPRFDAEKEDCDCAVYEYEKKDDTLLGATRNE